jgi:hypothetical protein
LHSLVDLVSPGYYLIIRWTLNELVLIPHDPVVMVCVVVYVYVYLTAVRNGWYMLPRQSAGKTLDIR